jgi:hypothetical protein
LGQVAELEDVVGATQLGEQVGHHHHRPSLAPPGIRVVPEVEVGALVEPLVALIEQQQLRLAD